MASAVAAVAKFSDAGGDDDCGAKDLLDTGGTVRPGRRGRGVHLERDLGFADQIRQVVGIGEGLTTFSKDHLAVLSTSSFADPMACAGSSRSMACEIRSRWPRITAGSERFDNTASEITEVGLPMIRPSSWSL